MATVRIATSQAVSLRPLISSSTPTSPNDALAITYSDPRPVSPDQVGRSPVLTAMTAWTLNADAAASGADRIGGIDEQLKGEDRQARAQGEAGEIECQLPRRLPAVYRQG